jgi:glucose dehydrogenase
MEVIEKGIIFLLTRFWRWMLQPAFDWHYQLVHHDLWDWDIPTHPILTTITKDGKKRRCCGTVNQAGIYFYVQQGNGQTHSSY